MLATIATALGIPALLLGDRPRIAAITSTTLGASQLFLGLVRIIGLQLAGGLLR